MKKPKYGQQPREPSELDFATTDCVVIDIGSSSCKVGYAGDDRPLFSMRTCVSSKDSSIVGNNCFANALTVKQPSMSRKSKQNEYTSSRERQEKQNMEEALEKMSHMKYTSLEWPYQHGRISGKTAMSNMDKIWSTLWNNPKLETSSDSQPVLISEAAGIDPEHRKQIAEIMFEKYKVPELYFALQPVLAMYSTGRTSGLAIDIGHQLTQVVPMYEGFALDHAILTYRMGGEDITKYLRDLIMGRLKAQGQSSSIPFSTIRGFAYTELIKESLGQVRVGSDSPQDETLEYILPDRTRISIGQERFDCTELLFNPRDTMDKAIPSITDMVHQSYDMCDDYIKSLIVGNVGLFGGSSKFKGLRHRLSNELAQIMYNTHDPNVEYMGGSEITGMAIHTPREPDNATWIGGSMLASLQTFSGMSIKKSAYDNDPNIIFSQCF